MKSMSAIALLILGTSVSVSALAQTCPTGVGQDLSQTEISTLLSGRYVYGTQYDGQYFNLLHAAGGSGSITDYKRGPNHPSDKSAVVGSYSTGQVGGRAVVTYTYGSFVYSYSISPKPTGQNAPAPGPYVLCQRAGANVGSAINATVSVGPGLVQP